jgi:hypothetical protein
MRFAVHPHEQRVGNGVAKIVPNTLCFGKLLLLHWNFRESGADMLLMSKTCRVH